MNFSVVVYLRLSVVVGVCALGFRNRFLDARILISSRDRFRDAGTFFRMTQYFYL